MILLALDTPASATTPDDLLDLLQPGSRPALGLGGDPFLSPLEDQCGWWARPGFGRERSLRLEASGSAPLAPGAVELDGRRYSWSALGSARVLGRTWLLATEMSSPRWEAGWRGASGGLSLGGEGTLASMGVRVPEVWPGITLQAGAPLVSPRGAASGATWAAGGRFRRAGLAVQANWERARLPELFRSDLYGEPVAASLNGGAEEYAAQAGLRLWRNMGLEGSFRHTDLVERDPRTKALVYHLAPSGRGRTSDAALAWRGMRGPGITLRWTERTLDARANASWGGQRFGELTYARADLRSLLVGAEWRGPRARWLADAEWAELSGSARAVVESWPFTSTLVDLLGQRRIYRAQARTTWSRWHVGYERSFGPALAIQAGLGWYQIRPDASLASWRPAFLVFGRADLERDALDVSRARLATVALGASCRLGPLRARLGAQQVVFADRQRRSGDPSTGVGPPPPAGGSDPVGDRSRWPGGTRVEASLERRF